MKPLPEADTLYVLFIVVFAFGGAASAVEETGPNAEEVICLLQLNHLRADPAWETARLMFAAEGGISSVSPNLDYKKCRQELALLEPAPPLVFDLDLMRSARLHARYMIQHDKQTHEEIAGKAGFTGVNSSARMQAAGYSGMPIGENVFLRAVSPWNSLRGFIIDWGPDADGMQSPRGHRIACLSKRNREVGVGVIRYADDLFMSTCHNFGFHRLQPRFVGGVVYRDKNKNARYDVGEGIAGLSVSADSGEQVSTLASGVFTLGLQHQGAVTINIAGEADAAEWKFAVGAENIFIETQEPQLAAIEKSEQEIQAVDLTDELAALDLWCKMRSVFMTQEQGQRLLDPTVTALKTLRSAQMKCMDLFAHADEKEFKKAMSILEQPYRKHAVLSWFKEARQFFPVYQDAKGIVDALRSGKHIGANQVSKQIKKSRRLLEKLREPEFYDALRAQVLMLQRALARK